MVHDIQMYLSTISVFCKHGIAEIVAISQNFCRILCILHPWTLHFACKYYILECLLFRLRTHFIILRRCGTMEQVFSQGV